MISIGIPGSIALSGAAALFFWLNGYFRPIPLPERSFDESPPKQASSPVVPATGIRAVSTLPPPPSPSSANPDALAGSSVADPGSPVSASPAPPSSRSEGIANSVQTAAHLPAAIGDWPGFRGPNRDDISPETIPLANRWGPQGPPLLWSQALGEGYASPAVLKDRVYLLDYDAGSQADALRCFSFSDGREIWRRSYPSVIKRNHGMSRTVPAVTDRFAVTLGPKCQVMCVDAATGAVRWRRDLVSEFGATVPEWYAGQCPLIDGGRIILAPGGNALMIALDPATGKILWRTPNPRGWLMTHSSILPMTFNGKRMYVYCGSGGVAGVSASDGALLWDTTEWTIRTATVPTPLPVGGGKLFLTGGYGAGAMMIQLEEKEGRFNARTLFRLKPSDFGSDQQTPIFYGGYVYGVIPGGQLACLNLSGKTMWKSGSTQRFGLGSYCIADGMIYLMNDRGTLTLVDASPKGYRRLAEAQPLSGPESWGPLVITGGRLIARDLTRMVCLNIARR